MEKSVKMSFVGKNLQDLSKWTEDLRFFKELDSTGWSVLTSGQCTCILPKYIKIFLSETTWYIKAKFHREDLYEGGS